MYKVFSWIKKFLILVRIILSLESRRVISERDFGDIWGVILYLISFEFSIVQMYLLLWEVRITVGIFLQPDLRSMESMLIWEFVLEK